MRLARMLGGNGYQTVRGLGTTVMETGHIPAESEQVTELAGKLHT